MFLAFPELQITQFRPKVTIAREFFDERRFTEEEDYRLSLRYQLAWERGKTSHLFITHNDCVFHEDTIGLMMDRMGDEFVGAGAIGQCWNCPASYAGRCSGPTHETFAPSYEEAIELVRAHPGPRTPEWSINKEEPAPFPECRLNEFACLVNKAAVDDLVMPKGPVVPFGAMTGDIGSSWFRGLRVAGFRFIDERQGYVHAPFSETGAGNPASHIWKHYKDQEERARAFLKQHFEATEKRVTDLIRISKVVE
jgi:hypothetical protein